MARNDDKMGLGKLGGLDIAFKRKFRWTFAIKQYVAGKEVPEWFVKIAARPNWTTEETEINYLHAKDWIPGKTSFETMTVTYYDITSKQSAGDIQPLWDWLATVYEFPDPDKLRMGTTVGDYGGVAELKLYNGQGDVLEYWELHRVWPQAVNFGDLDYSSSDECNIELTLRYSQAFFKPAACSPITPKYLGKGC